MARHLYSEYIQGWRLHHNLPTLHRHPKERRLHRTRRPKVLKPTSPILPPTHLLHPAREPQSPRRRLLHLPTAQPPNPNPQHQPSYPHSRRSRHQPPDLHLHTPNPTAPFPAPRRNPLPLRHQSHRVRTRPSNHPVLTSVDGSRRRRGSGSRQRHAVAFLDGADGV